MKISSSAAVLLLAAISPFVSAQTTIEIRSLGDIAIYPERFAPATVISLNEPVLSAQIGGRIEQVPARVGDLIAKNDVLVEIDCADHRLARQSSEATLASAKAREHLAQNQLDRALSLVQNNLLSVEDVDTRRSSYEDAAAGVRSATAQLEISRLNESRCQVRAPFNALILERHASVGQLAAPGTPLLLILDLESLEISAQVFADDANQFEQPLTLEFETRGLRYPLELQRMVAALDRNTRNREVRLTFASEATLPGTSGRLVWNDPRPHLPAEFFIERGGVLGYFVSNNNRAHFIPVPDAQAGRSTPISAPLNQQIVTRGFAALSEGDRLSGATE